MTPEQWRHARDLFEEAVEQPLAERAAWLEARGEAPEVVEEVRSLLAHHARAGAFLSEPVLNRAGHLLDQESRFANGDVIGPYRIEREVGRGGMGHVFLATDTRLGRQVALKVLASASSQDGSQRERLRREARAAASLRHPGICTVYAFEEIGDDVLLATEFVDGHTLCEEIDGGRRPSADRLARAARDLAAALAVAHAAGITHRDLKPENVMCAADGQLKILDFGLALTAEPPGEGGGAARVTSPGTLVGTPMYMAPEQIEGRPADARTDIWALGLLLYEYASGAHPFAAATPLALAARILDGAVAPLAAVRSDLPRTVVTVVHRCLARLPADRYGSALDIVAALDRAEEPGAATEAVRWWRIHQWVVIGLYVVALVVAWAVLQRSAARAADAAFVFVMVVATIGGVLRGHLLFTHRVHDRTRFHHQLRQVSTTLLGVDGALGAGLVVEGLWVALADAVPGAVIAGLGFGIVLTRLVLERSTTEGAFGPDDAAGTGQA